MPKDTNHHHRSRRIIKSFEIEALKKRPFIIRVADFLTSKFGTVTFLLGNAFLYGFWMLLNSQKIGWLDQAIDPFPFSFLNSFVSLEALALTIIVLISQNRASQIDKLRQEFQLQVSLYSEKEMTKILALVDKLAQEKGIKIEDDEVAEMLKEIDASYIERKLEEQINKAEGLHPFGNGDSKKS